MFCIFSFSIMLHFKRKTDHRRGQYNGSKIGVACLICSRVSKTSYEITEVQLRKHYLMKSGMLTASDPAAFHNMLRVDTFINSFASTALLAFENYFFTYCHANLHCNYHDLQLHGRNMLRCVFSLTFCFKVFLCLNSSGL